MVLFVSIAGADNVGKTTQLKFLKRLHPDVELREGVRHFDEELMKTSETSHYKSGDWWFNPEVCSDEEFILEFSRAFQKRFEADTGDAKVVLFDRGSHMFQCMFVGCLATRSLRNKEGFPFFDGEEFERAIEEAEAKVKKIAEPLPSCKLEILLTFQESRNVAVNKTMSYENENTVYTQYQYCLHKVLEEHEKNDAFTQVISVKNKSIVEVQRELRGIINTELSDEVALPLFLHRLRRVIVIPSADQAQLVFHELTGKSFEFLQKDLETVPLTDFSKVVLDLETELRETGKDTVVLYNFSADNWLSTIWGIFGKSCMILTENLETSLGQVKEKLWRPDFIADCLFLYEEGDAEKLLKQLVNLS